MRRAHPGLLAALAAATLAGGQHTAPGNNVRIVDGQSTHAFSGVFGINRLGGHGAPNLASIILGSGILGGRYNNTYRTRFPVSVAQGKRNARKRRNVLRARGHHRQAVR